MTNKTTLADELLIHSIITEIVLGEVQRIKTLPRLDRTDVLALEKYAKIYGCLMAAAGTNKKLALFTGDPESEE